MLEGSKITKKMFYPNVCVRLDEWEEWKHKQGWQTVSLFKTPPPIQPFGLGTLCGLLQHCPGLYSVQSRMWSLHEHPLIAPFAVQLKVSLPLHQLVNRAWTQIALCTSPVSSSVWASNIWHLNLFKLIVLLGFVHFRSFHQSSELNAVFDFGDPPPFPEPATNTIILCAKT